jgi:drug/metabolite transporter (DMT)-like permease
MSRKSLFHFVLVGFLWGIPYLLMKVAVEDFPPAAVVAGRTLIGASILIPIAIYRKKFKGAVLGFKFVAFYALLEMIGPWILITTAEQKINSGLAGLLVSTVPIFATIIVFTKRRSLSLAVQANCRNCCWFPWFDFGCWNRKYYRNQ